MMYCLHVNVTSPRQIPMHILMSLAMSLYHPETLGTSCLKVGGGGDEKGTRLIELLGDAG